MFGGQSAAQLLASQYEREGKKMEVERVIRTAGKAFEEVAAEAKPMLALAWLEPVYEEYVNRGMKEDAARVQAAIVEKGKNIAGDLKDIRIPVEFNKDQVDRLLDQFTQGSPATHRAPPSSECRWHQNAPSASDECKSIHGHGQHYSNGGRPLGRTCWQHRRGPGGSCDHGTRAADRFLQFPAE